MCLASYGYVYRRGHRKVNIRDGEKKEYSDRNLRDKLWYEVCKPLVTNWIELSAEQKSEKLC